MICNFQEIRTFSSNQVNLDIKPETDEHCSKGKRHGRTEILGGDMPHFTIHPKFHMDYFEIKPEPSL
jgi:hypothetical protein